MKRKIQERNRSRKWISLRKAELNRAFWKGDTQMAHILVVEDDADISRLLCRILSKGGYEAVPAYSGTEAKLRLEMSEPDLILLDLMLPGVNGEEIISYVRDELKKPIPIIVLSAKNALENKLETMKSGAMITSRSPSNRRKCSCASWRSSEGAVGETVQRRTAAQRRNWSIRILRSAEVLGRRRSMGMRLH